MKILRKISIIGISFSLLGMLLFGTSCKKESNSGGMPVITKVSLVDPLKFDSTFTKASRGTVIVLRGENINDATEVYFNDYPADFNPVYNTKNNLILMIPEDAPTIGTDADVVVPNEIRLVTKHGVARFSFVLQLPPPTIYSLSNENALPGDSIFIYGSSYFGVEKITFPGNIEVTNFTTNKEGTVLKTVVPSNLTSRGPISVQTVFGVGTTFFSINNINGPGVINNFDDIDFYNVPGGGYSVAVSNSSVNFPGNYGKYGVFDVASITAGNPNWYEAGRSITLGKQKLISVDSLGEPASKYALKFEIFVKTPWVAGQMRITHSTIPTPTYTAIYKPWASLPSKSYQTTRWETVTIPLTDFKLNNGLGESAQTLSNLLDNTGTNGIHLRFYSEAGIPVGKVYMAVDNMRLIRIAK